MTIIEISKDNPTNGDAIKALFPNMEFRLNKAGIYSNYFNDIRIKEVLWNTPYKENEG